MDNFVIICRLRIVRERKGYTQDFVAKSIGISRNAYSALERGESLPSLPVAYKLSYFFKCNLRYLFDFKFKKNF